MFARKNMRHAAVNAIPGLLRKYGKITVKKLHILYGGCPTGTIPDFFRDAVDELIKKGIIIYESAEYPTFGRALVGLSTESEENRVGSLEDALETFLLAIKKHILAKESADAASLQKRIVELEKANHDLLNEIDEVRSLKQENTMLKRIFN